MLSRQHLSLPSSNGWNRRVFAMLIGSLLALLRVMNVSAGHCIDGSAHICKVIDDVVVCHCPPVPTPRPQPTPCLGCQDAFLIPLLDDRVLVFSFTPEVTADPAILNTVETTWFSQAATLQLEHEGTVVGEISVQIEEQNN